MGDEPDLDPDINKDFFKSNILELEPSLLTEAGIKCFERFFKTVNIKVLFLTKFIFLLKMSNFKT